MYTDVSDKVIGYSSKMAMLNVPIDTNGSGIQYRVYIRDGSDQPNCYQALVL